MSRRIDATIICEDCGLKVTFERLDVSERSTQITACVTLLTQLLESRGWVCFYEGDRIIKDICPDCSRHTRGVIKKLMETGSHEQKPKPKPKRKKKATTTKDFRF